MGLEQADAWAQAVCQLEKLLAGCHISGNTEVGLLLLHDRQQL